MILRLKDGEFARARAEAHAGVCAKCTGLLRSLDRLDRLGGFAAQLTPVPLTLLADSPAQGRYGRPAMRGAGLPSGCGALT